MTNETAPAPEKKQTPQQTMKEDDKKQPWTLQRCHRAARRFDSVAAWQAGASSSYKAAVSHGWLKECSAHMTETGSVAKTKVTKPKAAARPAPVKKSA